MLWVAVHRGRRHGGPPGRLGSARGCVCACVSCSVLQSKCHCKMSTQNSTETLADPDVVVEHVFLFTCRFCLSCLLDIGALLCAHYVACLPWSAYPGNGRECVCGFLVPNCRGRRDGCRTAAVVAEQTCGWPRCGRGLAAPGVAGHRAGHASQAR